MSAGKSVPATMRSTPTGLIGCRQFVASFRTTFSDHQNRITTLACTQLEGRAMPSDQPSIPLAKAIEDLRAELLTALREGVGKEMQFRLKPIELELKVAVTKQVGANAGIKFWVIDLGGKGSYDNATTHTLKLTLEPVGRDGSSEVVISQTDVPRPGG
jgi:hypothetical protein